MKLKIRRDDDYCFMRAKINFSESNYNTPENFIQESFSTGSKKSKKSDSSSLSLLSDNDYYEWFNFYIKDGEDFGFNYDEQNSVTITLSGEESFTLE